MDEAFWAAMVGATLRVATPLILCALAGLLSERSGVVDIGLEGKLLAAAFAAAATGAVSGQWALAVLAAMAVALAMSMLHALACVRHGGNQVVSGVALNIMAAGLTAVLGSAWFAQGGQTPTLSDAVRLGPWLPSPPAHWVDSGLGLLLWQGLLQHSALVHLTLLLVPLVAWLTWSTRWGLRLRAVGENPHMVETAGVSVAGMRVAALALNGLLCGLAGAYLVLSQSASFVPHMSAGRGFMALAALIFGKWRPWWALAACLLFGFLDAVSIRLQGVALPGVGQVPVQAIQALPYALTVLLLAGWMGQATAPKALGEPYHRGRA
ncbi:MAG: ABC transporter permease [Limnohabitans sp.]